MKARDVYNKVRGALAREFTTANVCSDSERSRQDWWGGFLAACFTVGDPQRVASAAKILDDLFTLPDLIDRWMEFVQDQENEDLPAPARLAVPPDKDLLSHIRAHGFASAVQNERSDRTVAAKLKRIVEDSNELYQLFHDIRFGGDLSEHWAKRFIDVGRLPEFRVFDLIEHRPVDPSIHDRRSLWPSPLSATLTGHHFEGALRGLEHFADRPAHIGLFAPGSDDVLTRKPQFKPREQQRADKAKANDHSNPDINKSAWDTLVAHADVRDDSIREQRITAGQIRVSFKQIPNARSLCAGVLVVAIT